MYSYMTSFYKFIFYEEDKTKKNFLDLKQIMYHVKRQDVRNIQYFLS